MSIKEFKLPDPGEGLTEAEIVSWKVQPGDTVKVNQIVVEIETAKSLVELPVPFAGQVESLLADEGSTVEVGTPIIAIQTAAAGSPSAQTADPEQPRTPGAGSPSAQTADPVGAAPFATEVENAPEEGAVEPGMVGGPAAKTGPADPDTIEEGKIGGTTSTGRTAVLVGYGVKQTEAKRRPRSGSAQLADDGQAAPTSAVSARSGSAQLADDGQAAPPSATEQVRALAKPPVRRLAKDLGVDLAAVTGSGAGGIVTRSDLESYAANGAGTTQAEPATTPEPPAYVPGAVVAGGPGLPSDGTARGPAQDGARETRTPVKGVRKVTAEAMVHSAFTAPHVTEWVTCDVTATMDLVERLKQDKEFRDVKVTPLLVLAKAMCLAIRRHPGINVSWDEANQEIVTKHYVNLGIAAATPRGLMVPNIKDADRLPMLDLARAIGELTATARDGRTPPADMSGGTITITNVGVFGVDTGTPILNPGEAAIVAFGAVRRMPWVVTADDGSESVEPRWVTQLGMSFDHRMVDGELGSRYLADVAAILSDPARALVWG